MLGFAFQEAYRSQQKFLQLQEQHGGNNSQGSSGNLSANKPKNRRRRRTRARKLKEKDPLEHKDLYFSLRCGMVQTSSSALAIGRVVVVNWNLDVVFDAHVKITVPVTNYCSQISGVLPNHNQRIIGIEQVRQKISSMLKGKILVGHGLELDLPMAEVSHPQRDTRDLAVYEVLQKEYTLEDGVVKVPRGLDELTAIFLSRDLGHGPVAQASACMLLYKHLQEDWEQEIARAEREVYLQRQILRGMRLDKDLSIGKLLSNEDTTVWSDPHNDSQDNVSEISSSIATDATLDPSIWTLSHNGNATHSYGPWWNPIRKRADRSMPPGVLEVPTVVEEEARHHLPAELLDL